MVQITPARSASTMPVSRATVVSSVTAQSLTSTQINALGARDLAALDVSLLSQDQLRGVTSTTISKLSTTQVGKLSGTQLASLSATQFSGFSTAQASAISTSAIASVSATQIGGMTAKAIAGLTLKQFAAMSDTTVGGFATATMAALTSTQVAGLLATKGTALSTAQISRLTTSQLAGTTLVGNANGLQFNLKWDRFTASAPSGFRNAVIEAAIAMAASFQNKVVVNVQVGYGELNGSAVPRSAAAESSSTGNMLTYSALSGALKQKAGNSSVQAAAANSLSTGDPTNGGRFYVSSAEQKALGLKSGTSTALDGYVSLSSALPFVFDQTATTGKYDAVGAIEHELSEVMGRVASVGSAIGSGVYTALDLYRYQSTGGSPSRSLGASSASYFSIDGGGTNLGNFNPTAGAGDAGDLNITASPDPFGYSVAGARQALTGNGVVTMAALGWDMSASGAQLAAAARAYQSV